MTGDDQINRWNIDLIIRAYQASEPVNLERVLKSMSAINLTLELSPEVLDKIHILQGTTKAPDIAEVVRRSLAIYDLIIEHQHEGGKLVFRHADGTQEILNVQ